MDPSLVEPRLWSSVTYGCNLSILCVVGWYHARPTRDVMARVAFEDRIWLGSLWYEFVSGRLHYPAHMYEIQVDILYLNIVYLADLKWLCT
jgi:hypothetical protein